MANKKRRQRKTRRPRSAIVQKRPENYLYFGWNGQGFGVSSGGADPTLGYNDYILNGAAQIATGTGTNQRLGRKILFTRLTARMSFYNDTEPQRVRVIVGLSRTSDAISTLTTVNAITSFIEGNAVLESPYQGSVVGPIDKAISPSSDYVILHDQIYANGAKFGTATSMPFIASAELDIPLMLQRTYDNSGTPDLGDWFMYICSDTASLNQTLHGYMRLEYINQWTWEGVGRGIRGFVSEVGNTVDHVVNSKLVQYANRAAPYVFSAMA
jgi:hypothetical protein